jgi:ankyrin repeat protein
MKNLNKLFIVFVATLLCAQRTHAATGGYDDLKDDLKSVQEWARTTKEALKESAKRLKTKYLTSTKDLNKKLITAARAGNLNEVRLLLESGALPDWTDSDNKFTALSYATKELRDAKASKRGDLQDRKRIFALLIPAQSGTPNAGEAAKLGTNALLLAVKSLDKKKIDAVLAQNPTSTMVGQARQLASDKSQREDTPAKDRAKFAEIKEQLGRWLQAHS